MNNEESLAQEAFASLLDWLGSDELAAARKYESIRSGLIRVFAGRGCPEAERLADRTIDRVAGKLTELNGTYKGDPALYFYGVAKNIFFEWQREPKEVGGLGEPGIVPAGTDARRQTERDCLRECLNSLSESDQDLIADYYHHDKRKRIECRRELAERLRISAHALQMRVHRLRKDLSKCIRRCADEK